MKILMLKSYRKDLPDGGFITYPKGYEFEVRSDILFQEFPIDCFELLDEEDRAVLWKNTDVTPADADVLTYNESPEEME